MTNENERRWTEGDVATGAARIHYYRTGHGERPPIVLVHGFSDSGLCWRRTAEVLEVAFDVVMIDARNHGQSSTSVGGLSEMIDDLAAVITDLHLVQPVVVGHSIGASTAAGMAARYPNLVSRIVLEDPPWRNDGGDSDVVLQERRDGVLAYISSLSAMTADEIAALGRRQHPEWDDLDRPDWVVSKQQVRAEAADALEPKPWLAVVEQIQCPTLLIHGDPDRGGLLTPDLADRIAGINARVMVRGVEQAGHNIRRENFAAFTDTLSAFLKSAR